MSILQCLKAFGWVRKYMDRNFVISILKGEPKAMIKSQEEIMLGFFGRPTLEFQGY